MHRRRLLAGAAALATTGLAGCSSEGGDGEGDGTAEQTETATSSPTPVPAEDVEWRDGDALAAETLAEVHGDAVVEAGSVRVFSEADTEYGGEERPDQWLFSQTYDARFERERERQFLEQDITEVDETTTAYIADGTAYYRLATDAETRYQSESVDRTTAEFDAEMRREALAGVGGLDGWNLTVDGATTHEGVAVTRFTADAYEPERTIPETVESAAATVLVDADGVVRYIEQTWDGTHAGEDATITITIEFEGIGDTTVAEPAWLDEARDASDGGDGGTATESARLRGGATLR
ncbi:DUF7537 family lipoprotein [Haloparvum sedimenti]|uniref:DUF7537 family lipoprotein n=1 Tax=Haloparvum sedimenti TaxID=1678448 RepID=UPI00071E91EA|nr:hypothetical protein [Haloparvum sedimenti]